MATKAKIDPDIEKIVATNRKAYRDYFVISRYEAGIVLKGTEVKAIREGNINLKDSYVFLRMGELFLANVHIGMFKPASKFNHEPERERKLLLHRREINKISHRISEKGFALAPLQVYFKKGKLKVEIGLVQGKRSYDKRDSIKQRDYERTEERKFKTR